MRTLLLLVVLASIGVGLAGCAAPMDMSKLKPEEKFNPAISAEQREHMAHRGPK